MTINGGSQVIQYAAIVYPKRFHDGQHPFDVAAAVRGKATETRLAPKHATTNAPFGDVVSGLDTRLRYERPEGRRKFEDLAARPSGRLLEGRDRIRSSPMVASVT